MYYEIFMKSLIITCYLLFVFNITSFNIRLFITSVSYRLTFEEFKMWVQRNPEIVDYIGELYSFFIHLLQLLNSIP